jgi:membrane protease YdiL (CAAX protease family)
VISERRRAAIALLIVVPAPTIGALATFWILPGPIGLAIYALGKAVLYGTPAIWSRWVDREPWSLSPARQGGWGMGAATGVAIAAAILAGYAILSAVGFDASALRPALEANGLHDPVRFALAAAWLVVVNALLEEYAFRWFITSRWERVLGPGGRGASLLSAVSFTIHHVVVLAAFFSPLAVVVGSFGVFAGGLIWSLLYRRYRSVRPVWLSHAIADVAILAIGWRLLSTG